MDFGLFILKISSVNKPLLPHASATMVDKTFLGELMVIFGWMSFVSFFFLSLYTCVVFSKALLENDG